MWSIGSWGGSEWPRCSAGSWPPTFNWRIIFYVSVVVSVVSTVLLWGIPESRAVQTAHRKFDAVGLVIFMISTLALMLDGTWQEVLSRLQTGADQDQDGEWVLAVDSTVARAHQHAAGAPRTVARDDPDHGGTGVAAVSLSGCEDVVSGAAVLTQSEEDFS